MSLFHSTGQPEPSAHSPGWSPGGEGRDCTTGKREGGREEGEREMERRREEEGV